MFFSPLSSLRYDLCVVVPCIGRAHSIKDQLFSVFLTGSHSLFSMDGCMHISLLHTHTQPQSSMHCSFSVRWHPAHNFTGNHYRSKCISYSPQLFCVGLFIKLLGRNFSGQVNRDRIVNQLEHEYLKKCMAEPNGLKWSVSVFELCKSALDQ